MIRILWLFFIISLVLFLASCGWWDYKKINIKSEGNDIKVENKIKSKNIDSNMKTINPNNYKSVKEFLNYFKSWSGIKLNVDLLKETFYINTYREWGYIVTKLDKEFILEIDEVNNKNIKNKVILDIFNSYKTDNYIHWEPTKDRSWVRLLEEHELPNYMKAHNDILMPYSGESFLERKSRLEDKLNKTTEDKKQLWYLNDFSWNYKEALIWKKESWIKKINYQIKWKVFNSWKVLKKAKIEVLNYENLSTFTNEKWEYTLNFETYPLTRLRLRATYPWLSDSYNGTYIVFNFNNQSSDNVNFSLLKPDTIKKIDKENLKLNKKILVESSLWNSFEFKSWVLINSEWIKYDWDFIVEIYEFNRNTLGMDNFLSLDNFDTVYWYTWDKMITNGMTYLLVKDNNWNELFISKKNPIITKQKIDIDYLLKNKQNWTSVLTKEELNLILEKSKKDWYSIDRKFLIERNITWLSPWWVLNRTRWIWENRPIKLLNKSWFKQSLYYNVD